MHWKTKSRKQISNLKGTKILELEINKGEDSKINHQNMKLEAKNRNYYLIGSSIEIWDFSEKWISTRTGGLITVVEPMEKSDKKLKIFYSVPLSTFFLNKKTTFLIIEFYNIRRIK